MLNFQVQIKFPHHLFCLIFCFHIHFLESYGGGAEERKQLINSLATEDGTFLHMATKVIHLLSSHNPLHIKRKNEISNNNEQKVVVGKDLASCLYKDVKIGCENIFHLTKQCEHLNIPKKSSFYMFVSSPK